MNAIVRRHQGTVTITLPIRTVSEANQREHWAKKAKRTRTQRNVARMVCNLKLSHLDVTKTPLLVTLARVSPRKLDDDNLRGALKAVRDGVADALGTDDGGHGRIVWEYQQWTGAAAVTIQVREA